MQYTPHYNLNLPEGADIVNPLIQDNPNYSAIDTALYDNKLRVIGNATHVKTGTNHAITRADSDIVAFKFVAAGDYATGDTFTVDGVTVTPRVADGSTIPNGAFKINNTVEAILDGTILNLINVTGTVSAGSVSYDNTGSGLSATNAKAAIDELASEKKNSSDLSSGSVLLEYQSAYYCNKDITIPSGAIVVANAIYGAVAYNKTSGVMVQNIDATTTRIIAFSTGGDYAIGDSVGVNYIAL